MRSVVMGRAVETYIHPQAVDPSPIMDGKDLAELSRRAALMDEVSRRDRDTLDQLVASRADLVANQQLAARARALADQRRQLEAQSLAELQQARADRQRLQGLLQARIADYQQEADAVGAEETNLSNLIRSKAAPTPASRGSGADGNGRTSSSGLIWPTQGPVTSPFGYRWGRLHAGIDIGVGIGTPIHAAKAGTVIFAGQMSGYGNVVVIDHGGGFSTLYAHQSRVGARARPQGSHGGVIGYSGNTGHSTGPHLHFETRVSGNPQNPRQYLP
jgi:murein DD-endopeptidase MepM/ murein hydrolase activator NlpD